LAPPSALLKLASRKFNNYRGTQILRTISLIMKHLGKTRPFLDATGGPLAGSIAEINYFRLGGIDQWVMMRGESANNPPLIHLHGGPGFSEMRLFRHFNSYLEKYFTIISWDQRGTAKSFDSRIPISSMNLEQFISDLDELVEIVRKKLNKNKVVIFGHSWGSTLGTIYAARFPEKVSVYVGSGQIGDHPSGESLSYAFALEEAKRIGNRKALKQVIAIGPPPFSPVGLWAERTWLQKFEGQMKLRAIWKLGRIVFGGPESSIADLPDFIRGFKFSLKAMWIEISKINLNKVAPSLEMPVFFFLGRRDHWVPPETSVEYFDNLVAPLKRLIWFENSGHEPFVDEAEKFNEKMVELVRPLVENESDNYETSDKELNESIYHLQ
jgi:pimeloyl-ACP methyl ester carboxylesterase